MVFSFGLNEDIIGLLDSKPFDPELMDFLHIYEGVKMILPIKENGYVRASHSKKNFINTTINKVLSAFFRIYKKFQVRKY